MPKPPHPFALPLTLSTLKPGRRRFLRGLVAGGAALGGLAASGCGGSGDGDGASPPADGPARFDHGVASGDPQADRVILWTRVSGVTGPVELRWQLAADEGFARVLAEGTVRTGPEQDHTVKVDAQGLAAGTTCWYRFSVGATRSPTGRTRTLPGGSVEQVRLAVFSCASYPTGWFNAYAHAAARGDLDAALHLGDYLYEYERGGYGSADAAALGREVEPATELLTLADYRERHAQYRRDPDLQALHAALPVIAVWDDHEFANDTWRDGAENHGSAEGDWAVRKAAAIQAYHEWLPTRVAAPERIWRGFDFGTLLSLHMLDTRVAGRDEQLAFADFAGGPTGFDFTGLAAAIQDPNRQLLGAEQAQWLQARLQASTATWQVLGQQVLMGRMEIPAAVATQQIGVSEFAALVLRAQQDPASLSAAERLLLALPSVPYNLDAWDGYGAAREAVFEMARTLDRNLVVLAGDTHNAWANDLRDAEGRAVGVEFAVSSVTSPGFETYLPGETPQVVASTFQSLLDTLVWCDTSQRGYLMLSATPEACQADWIFVDTIERREATARVARSLQTLPGAAGRRIVEPGA